jgi:heme-degrading monooxygenase HmoA
MAREHYASGNWLVTEGKEEEFIGRWRDWISKSTQNTSGFGSARLMQDVADSRHFLSFSDWEDAQSRDSWKASPEFAQGLAGCRELCEEFRGGDFSQVVGF